MRIAPFAHRIIPVVFTVLLSLTVLAPLFAAPDLDVAYISRTPRYQKYDPTYKNQIDPVDRWKSKPFLSPEQEKMKRWPSKGEIVTFTAVIKNPGKDPTGEFAYKWYFDGKEVGSGTLPSIEPGGQASTTYKWKWDSEWNDHTIKFVADPDNKIIEEIEKNNIVEDRTNALCYRFHCWKSLYDWFQTEARKINPDIASFDDWCQNQMRLMNEVFARAIYPTSPNGILERVRVDEIVIEPDDAPDPDPFACHAPANLEWDGRWGFAVDPYVKIFTENPDFIKGIYTWGLHEHSHQLGMFDLYQLNVEYKDNNKIKPELGHLITRNACVMASSGATHYSDHTAAFFNANLHKRRGYFGEFLYDLPKVCKIKLVDAYYRPLANANIKFFQTESRRIVNSPAFTGTTDADGMFTMPNRTCYGEVTTATGHHLHDNPWGMINVVGLNGIFFCEITKNGQTDYQYIEILPFNMAYVKGYKDTWTYELQTNIVPKGKVTQKDLYGIKMVSKKLGYAVGADGTILKCNGKSWSSVGSPTDKTLRAVDASKDGKLVCAVGDGGTVLITTGKKWAEAPVPTSDMLRTCAVVSPTTIVIGGDKGSLYRSTDKGQTWSKIDVTSSVIRSIRFTDQKNGIMTCDGGKTFYTVDGGAAWKAGTDAGGRNLVGCSMSTPTEAWACNDSGEVFQSTDGGKTWKKFAEFGYASPLNCIDMRKGGNGWLLGDWHKHYGTTIPYRLGNYNWTIETVTTFGDNGSYYGVSCISDTEAWAVGKGGLILRLVGGRN